MKKRNAVLVLFLFFLIFTLNFSNVFATSVDRMSFVNLKAFPGKTLKLKITLEGTNEERFGYWYTHYKKVEGDSDMMDITSWIKISPKDYSIKKGEKKVFSIKIKVPRKIDPGLWGALSVDAGKEGNSNERRTYIVFKDAPENGNVYSGLLIPISVNVLESTNFMLTILNFVIKNLLVIVLSIVILILTTRQFFIKKKSKN